MDSGETMFVGAGGNYFVHSTTAILYLWVTATCTLYFLKCPTTYILHSL